MIGLYQTRSTPVAAIRYDGSNLEEINTLLVQAGRGRVADMLEVGAWIVFTDSSFQILPDSAFQRIYEPIQRSVEVVETSAVDQPRTCYRCVNYAMTNGSVGFCTLFNEPIDSELLAAEDCSGYEPEQS